MVPPPHATLNIVELNYIYLGYHRIPGYLIWSETSEPGTYKTITLLFTYENN